jgi:flagella basal body P-ring formation protein FlgA
MILRITSIAVLTAVLASASKRAEGSSPIEDRIAEKVRADLPETLALESVQLPGDRAASERGDEVSIAWTSPPRAGTISVRIRLADRRELFALVKLVEMRRGLVTTRALAKGERIAAGDLKMRLVANAGERSLDVAPAALIGRPTNVSLAAGKALSENDVDLPPPLARGTEVQVVVRRGAVVITSRGVLERAARVGAWTSARVQVSLRSVRGVLADSSTLIAEGGVL